MLRREFSTSLADHLPRRVLPVSVEPPKDLQLLIDDEYSQIKELLKPGLRRVPDAQARLRGLLAMEAHVAENVRVSAKDVQRVQRAIRAGKSREAVFPRLGGIQTETEGEGLLVNVRFSKTEGAPVQFVQADDYEESAAIREVDLQAKFHWSPTELATKLKLSTAKAKALRWQLGIDQDPGCLHEFVFGSQRLLRFSDNALNENA